MKRLALSLSLLVLSLGTACGPGDNPPPVTATVTPKTQVRVGQVLKGMFAPLVNQVRANDGQILFQGDVVSTGTGNFIEFSTDIGVRCDSRNGSGLQIRPNSELELNWNTPQGTSSCSITSSRDYTFGLEPNHRLTLDNGQFIAEGDKLYQVTGTALYMMVGVPNPPPPVTLYPHDVITLPKPGTPVQIDVWTQLPLDKRMIVDKLPTGPVIELKPTQEEVSRSKFLQDVTRGGSTLQVFTAATGDAKQDAFLREYTAHVVRSWQIAPQPSVAPAQPQFIDRAQLQVQGSNLRNALTDKGAAVIAERIVIPLQPSGAPPTPTPSSSATSLGESSLLVNQRGQVLRIVYPFDSAADAAFKRLLKASLESGAYFDMYYKVFGERPRYDLLERLIQ